MILLRSTGESDFFMTLPSLVIKTFDGVAKIPALEWERLADPNFPFSDYAFLQALEASGSVGPASGWIPLILTAWAGDCLEGACHLYLKANSYGEYIFDWSWAKAYQQHGEPYYPKLTAAVPFTPATGPKLLFSKAADRPRVAALLIQAAKDLAVRLKCSSLHFLFVTTAELPYLRSAGLTIRDSFQYHWTNAGFASFADFLRTLKPKRRKQILREREQLRSEDLSIRIITGPDLRPEHAVLFHQFYLSTIHKMQATAYLNLEFFVAVFASMPADIVLILAEHHGAAVAGALYFKKGDSLFGRYWGAIKDVRNLHFEICYYQPIEWAITQNLKRFEAGAQGEHKMARGLLPELTFSAHWIRHPGFHRAIDGFIKEERTEIKAMFEEMRAHQPFL